MGFNIRILLIPFAFIYGIIVFLRNKLFDWGVLEERQFNIPLICIGNITVGGTGKTPLTEYLIQLLNKEFKVAVLSRGYKRKSKGFYLADNHSTPDLIGDEPYQIFNKNESVQVAVCEDRINGIIEMQKHISTNDVIILDDAFQHRYVKSGLSILLIDYNRPLFKDFLLPAGNLREGMEGMKRADIIVITKVTKEITPEIQLYWKNKLKLSSESLLFFSGIEYDCPKSVFIENSPELTLEELRNNCRHILLVTGIAEPKVMIEYLLKNKFNIDVLRFSDHHNFNTSDIQKISDGFRKLSGKNSIILTTEKDAVRIKYTKEYPENLKDKTYYLPIRVRLLENKEKEFDKLITNYVRRGKKSE